MARRRYYKVLADSGIPTACVECGTVTRQHPSNAKKARTCSYICRKRRWSRKQREILATNEGTRTA